jgi:type VI secretion system secreted protein VgrG
MSTTSQELRLVSIDTPLGKDVLLVRNFNATEAISSLFHFHLDLFSEKSALPLDGLIGKPISIALELGNGRQRFFHGIVSRFGHSGRGQIGRDPRFTAYYAEVVPWLWLLTRTTDCRIFQNLTVPEIIKKIFQDLGFRDFREGFTRTYTKWDYCVQYRESDFNFVSRLMEQEGIFYFFEHEKSKHTLILADAPDAHKPCPHQPQAQFSPEGGIGEREDVVTSWQMEQELRPGKYTLRDYHFEMPSKTLEVSSPTTVSGGGKTNFEIYDYQGEYTQQFNKPSERLGEVEPEGEKIVKLRMQEEETPHLDVRGSSYCRGFTAGYRFELKSPPAGVAAGQYVLTSVQHSAVQGGDFASGAETDVFYSNDFTCMPQRVPFRPARTTPKPVIQGMQTADVVGPRGEEIFTDKFGRVKVQFHWDREGKRDENSSCWIRVAQPWAGKRWGAMFLPRIGQEVVVAFQEGDPDQPLIIGSVYNAEQMPAYLGGGPDGAHSHDPKLSGVKSNSTTGGKGYNELRFDDTASQEQVFIHGQRNMDVRVEHDSKEWVMNDRHLKVGLPKGQGNPDMGSQYELVHRDKHLNVKYDQVEKIEGNMFLTIGKGENPNGGNLDIVVEKTKKELIEGGSHLQVQGARREQVGGSQSLTVGGDQQESVGMKHALDAGMEIHLKAGMKVVMEAGVQLTIKAAGGFIDISPAGVTIQGLMVLINSGGAPGVGSGSSPDAPQRALEARPIEPQKADTSVTGSKSAPEQIEEQPPRQDDDPTEGRG